MNRSLQGGASRLQLTIDQALEGGLSRLGISLDRDNHELGGRNRLDVTVPNLIELIVQPADEGAPVPPDAGGESVNVSLDRDGRSYQISLRLVDSGWGGALTDRDFGSVNGVPVHRVELIDPVVDEALDLIKLRPQPATKTADSRLERGSRGRSCRGVSTTGRGHHPLIERLHGEGDTPLPPTFAVLCAKHR